MTLKESAQDKELLERYRRASDTEVAAPSDIVRAAILAEGRRAAELRAKEVSGQPFDASRPAANESRWRITAFGTAGAALVAALLFAPRLWESGPVAPVNISSAPAVPQVVVPRADEKAFAPKAESRVPKSPVTSPPPPVETLQEYAPSPTAPLPVAPLPTAPQASNAPVLSSLATNADRKALARNTRALTALQSAVASGNVAQLTLLLDQGAALDARDELGRTPLMLAVMQRRVAAVRLLLDRGADPNVADSAGRTPLQQANQENLREAATLLERAGAQ